MEFPFEQTSEQWRERLSEHEYAVLRHGATDAPFTGEYTDTETPGKYLCKGCSQTLFHSDSKFHSGCGWPAFFQPASDSAVTELADDSHGMHRIEVKCSNCGSHLGHVFDGEGYPTPTDRRYCINSSALTLIDVSPSQQ